MSEPTVIRSAPIAIRQKNHRNRRRTLSSSLCSSTYQDQYEIIGTVLGEGAFGNVYKCRNRLSEVEYAVKIVRKMYANRAKVFREIEVYYQCQQSRNILHLVEFFEDENNFYLVFELIRGGSLHDRGTGPVEERSVKELILSISQALKFLHEKGIAHRDIKPANILLPDPASFKGAKLCDFDLASRSRIGETRGDLCMSSPVGSAEFMAPEVVRAFCASDDELIKYDQSCDIWSLGIIAYSLLAGRPPFEGNCGAQCGWDDGAPCDDCQELLFEDIQRGVLKFPDRYFKNVSRDAVDLISRCLAKNPKLRPSPQEILEHQWFGENTDGAFPDTFGSSDKSLKGELISRA